MRADIVIGRRKPGNRIACEKDVGVFVSFYLLVIIATAFVVTAAIPIQLVSDQMLPESALCSINHRSSGLNVNNMLQICKGSRSLDRAQISGLPEALRKCENCFQHRASGKTTYLCTFTTNNEAELYR